MQTKQIGGMVAADYEMTLQYTMARRIANVGGFTVATRGFCERTYRGATGNMNRAIDTSRTLSVGSLQIHLCRHALFFFTD